jgi:site-specific recombinase XerD
MLERYFVRPETVDRIRASWLGEPIERYVEWLTVQDYRPSCVSRRVPILMRFAEFARAHGATSWEQLPSQVDPFAAHWMERHGRHCRTAVARAKVLHDARNAVRQMLRLVVAGYAGGHRRKWAEQPFRQGAPEFFTYLHDERGLRPASVVQYEQYLGRFETYLARIELQQLADLAPPVLSAFVIDSSPALGKSALRGLCGVLRVFLRYLHRQRLTPTDLSAAVESPRSYRQSEVPRAISWADVRRMLAAVDRRTPIGRRDYAILLLLVTYGLRAREVAALTLDDLDWQRERLRVPERKAGHSTAYPLSPLVGAAILDYLQHGRPSTESRQVFFRVLAPHQPLGWQAVSGRASHYLHRAGIAVGRPGSHTLRHTCVQRLVDADFALKTIGDYVGHASADSTRVYAKVAVEALREVALGDGEAVL